MSERDPIVAKIKKLLRMKRGGTPDEIATALSRHGEVSRRLAGRATEIRPAVKNDGKQPLQICS